MRPLGLVASTLRTKRATEPRMKEPGQPRYEILDGLRGVAAACVVLFHIGTRVLSLNIIMPHGYLAVDFFFALSGFVLAHAYGRKLSTGTMAFSDFAWARMRRLMPLAVLGCALGSAYLIFSPLPRTHPEGQNHAALSAIFNLFLLPSPWTIHSSADLFPTNGPMWSLFLEVVFNFVWAAALIRLPTFVLSVIAILSAALISIAAIKYGSANLGWAWSFSNILGGSARIAYGFLVGAIIYRFRPTVKRSAIIPIIASLSLIAVLWGPGRSGLYDALAIVFAMPTILYLAASADFGIESSVVRTLGILSFPLYAVHFPILMLMGDCYSSFKVGFAEIISLSILLVIGMTSLAAYLYDGPIQRSLRRQFSPYEKAAAKVVAMASIPASDG